MSRLKSFSDNTSAENFTEMRCMVALVCPIPCAKTWIPFNVVQLVFTPPPRRN